MDHSLVGSSGTVLMPFKKGTLMPSLGVTNAFREASPTHVLWTLSSKELEVIGTAELEQPKILHELIMPVLKASSTDGGHRLSDQLVRIADKSVGGVAFLSVLNNSLHFHSQHLSEGVGQKCAAAAIFDAALACAPEIQQRFVMFSRLPWAANSYAHAIDNGSHVGVPIVHVGESISDTAWKARSQLLDILSTSDDDRSVTQHAHP